MEYSNGGKMKKIIYLIILILGLFLISSCQNEEDTEIGSRWILGQTGHIASLTIETDPYGAEIYVDGVRRGVSPITITNLNTGNHLVRVKKAEFDYTKKVYVGFREKAYLYYNFPF
jgi:hypothetical protein